MLADIVERLSNWKHASFRRDGSTLETMNEAADEITSLREQLEKAKKDGWISVKDRLPNDDCRVVAATWTTLTGKQHIDIASYRAGGKYFDVVVTHWQPLPEPPKE